MPPPDGSGRRRPDRGRAPGKEVVRRASAMPARRPAGAGLARGAGRRRIVVDAVVVVGRAATHERTRDAARWLARNAVLYLATGAWVLARRWWEARTNARYERLMRAAEAAGDYERLTDWEQRARAGPGTAAPPPDGLDHRPAGPGPRRRGRGHVRDRVPARVGRGAGHRPPGHRVAAHPGAEGRRRRSRGWCGCST